MFLGDSSFSVRRRGGLLSEWGRMLRTATSSWVSRLNDDVRKFKLAFAGDSRSIVTRSIIGGGFIVEIRRVVFLLIVTGRAACPSPPFYFDV